MSTGTSIYAVVGIDLDGKYAVLHSEGNKVMFEMKSLDELEFIKSIHTKYGEFKCGTFYSFKRNSETMKKILLLLKNDLPLMTRGNVTSDMLDNEEEFITISLKFRIHDCSYDSLLSDYVECQQKGTKGYDIQNKSRKNLGLPEIPCDEEVLVKLSNGGSGILEEDEVPIEDYNVEVTLFKFCAEDMLDILNEVDFNNGYGHIDL